MGALVLAVPDISRPELLFAVRVPAGFRASPTGRRSIAMFRILVGLVVLACLCALLLSPARQMNALVSLSTFSTLAAGGIGFYLQNRRLDPFRVDLARPREAELTNAPERLPWFAWLGAGPFAVIGAAAVFLYLNWDRLPARVPIHFGADGVPNRWVAPKGLYGLLLFGAEVSAWLLVMALAGWFGSRRSRFRPVMLGGMVAAEYLAGLLFGLVAVQPLLGVPIWTVVLAPMIILIPLIFIIGKKAREASEPMDPTPQECWKGDVIYFNPNDAVLFVEKHNGVGYTFNFANRWSWALLAGLAFVIASAFFILP
jgi:uncharacterized membrane protein